MSQADGAPDEEVGETGEGEEPAEDSAAVGRLSDEGEETKGDLDQDTPDGTALLVDVGEEARSHTALGHGLHRAGGTEGATVGDGDDGNGDDGVENGRKNLDAGILDGKDEGGGLGVGAGGTQEAGVVGRDNEAENEEVDNVEESNTPEDLLASHWDGLARVVGLSGSKTDELSTTKGESGDDEDTSETVEAVLERTRVVPVLGAEVALVANATAVDYDTEDDEADAGSNLDETENKLNLSVSADAKDLDDGEDDEEDSNPDTHVEVIAPELDGDTGGNEFEGQNGQPGDGIVPAHGETPGVRVRERGFRVG